MDCDKVNEPSSEVVHEGLRPLKRREALRQATIRAKIEQGMESLRAGRRIPSTTALSNVEARISEIERSCGKRFR